ncbi:MAG: hypothetical protein RLN76_09260 [Phycisphaeraceae bacterium]
MMRIKPRASRIVTSAITASLLVQSLGCSLFVSDMQMIEITASDPRAEIVVDNRVVGTGTASVELSKRSSHVVMAKLGDRVGTAQVRQTISTTGILDLVGGFIILVPFLGVLGGGFNKLDPESVVVPLPQSVR